MYYRLKEPWAFRGWKRAPHALQAQYGEKKHDRPVFVPREQFLELLYCNGGEDVDLGSFSESGRHMVREMLGHGAMEESPDPMRPLAPWQRYRVFGSRHMDAVHWSITGRCNFNCRHCLMSAPDAIHPQLPLGDCLRIVDEIASCGINRVDVTGGEPLVRQDFEQIVRALSENGIDIGVLFTNASLLTSETIDMLFENGQHPAFQLSFDGLGHHDWLRGVPGAEEQADAAFRLLRERGVAVSAAMCIHRGNRDSLRATVNYLAGRGVLGLKVNAPQELGVWRRYSEEYALSEDEVWDAYRAYIPHYFADGMPLDVELDGYFRCKEGTTDYKMGYVHHVGPDADLGKVPYCESTRHNMHIDPEGRVKPCMGFDGTALDGSFPSVLEHHLGDLTLGGFYHDVVQASVADLAARNPECAGCAHLTACCGGCMAELVTDDGDYLAPDPRCCHFHKHVGEAAVREVADAAIAAAGLAEG